MPAFLPADERVLIIRDYAQKYGIHTFIETGTSEGFTVAAVLDDFTTIKTIEIDMTTYRVAYERFAPYTHVSCYHGDSGSLLVNIVACLPEPALFWLDGHYCGGNGRGAIDTPIKDELRSALHAPAGSVILIDDARLFGDMPEHTEEFKDYPKVSWVRDIAVGHGFEFILQSDIMRLVPCSK